MSRFQLAAPLALCCTLAACAAPAPESPNDAMVCRAYAARQSNVEVVSEGNVTRLLGTRAGRRSPHQGFLMRLTSGCVLIVRVEANTDFTGSFPLRTGDLVDVKGVYEFYPIGGVIHWTHRDPRGIHPGGYVRVGNQIYQ